ncbi:MAG: two-component regulator propeller domain-containing protein [Eubacterium sp.]|nr:two-component regulator propeller domain-containing protein [Eubacterium sp.]
MRKKAAAFLGALIACTLLLPPADADAETVSSISAEFYTSSADSSASPAAGSSVTGSLTVDSPAASSSVSDDSSRTNSSGKVTVSYDQYQRQIYDIVSSLHCEKTTSIADTGDVKLWIGTYDGLYSFDGQDMEHVDLGSVHAVNALYADADDNLWVGSNDNGISVVQNGQVLAVLKKDGRPRADGCQYRSRMERHPLLRYR